MLCEDDFYTHNKEICFILNPLIQFHYVSEKILESVRPDLFTLWYLMQIPCLIFFFGLCMF